MMLKQSKTVRHGAGSGRFSRSRNRVDPGGYFHRRGSLTIAVILAMFLTLLVGLVIATMGISEYKDTAIHCYREQALTAAEAGVDYAVWYINANGGSWPPPTTNGFTSGAYTPPAPLPSGGQFTVTVGTPTNPAWNQSGNLQVTSVGTMDTEQITVICILNSLKEDVEPWNNGVFSQVGDQSGLGGLFFSNSTVAGSVHVRGDGLLPITVVLGGTGSGGMFDNYDDAGGAPFNNIPSIQDPYTGLNDLKAKLRVRNGMINLGLTSEQIGTATPASPQDKGTIAASLTGTGLLGALLDFISAPLARIHADTMSTYDLGANQVPFPDLTNPITVSQTVGGVTYTQTYADYVGFLTSTLANGTVAPLIPGQENAYQIPGPLVIDGSNMSYVDPANPNNYLIVSNGVLSIHGVIWVQGSISFQPSGGGAMNLQYQGSGVLVSGGNIQTILGNKQIVNGQDININLKTGGQLFAAGAPGSGAGGFPTNVLALVSMGNIYASNSSAYEGAFFAQNQFGTKSGQHNIVGSVVAHDLSLDNDTHVFQVPQLVNNLPVGLPGAGPVLVGSGTYKVANYLQL